MTPSRRLRSLDVFRGLTVAAMILVNSPGSDAVFAPLRHADWHGCTPTDLIFPAFLVIMGVSAVFSDAARRERGEAPAETARRVFVRAALLVALGLLVNLFLYDGRDGLRLTGVLQRIALCWLAVEAFLRLDRPAFEPAAAVALLIGYQLLLGGDLTREGNLAYRLDARMFDGHLLADPWGDPEGLTSTLGAAATALFGLMAGRRLVRDGPAAAGLLAAAGLALAALGAAWSALLPLNKHLWTSSYAVFAGGLSLAGLALCLRLVETRPARWASPFEALGRRALTAYVLAGLAYGIQEFVRVPLPDGSPGNLKLLLTAALFGSWLPPKAASLAYALAFTGAAAAPPGAARGAPRGAAPPPPAAGGRPPARVGGCDPRRGGS